MNRFKKKLKKQTIIHATYYSKQTKYLFNLIHYKTMRLLTHLFKYNILYLSTID